MAVVKERKKLLIVLIALTALFLLGVYLIRKLPEQLIKSKEFSDVIRKEAELNEAIAEMKNKDLPDVIRRMETDRESLIFTEISYEELNNEKINKVFNEFSVVRIQNAMDNSEGGYVIFSASSSAMNLVRRNCRYGFYYSEENKPLDIFFGNDIASNTKVEVELSTYNKYWYWTEKITDNWWYYEVQLNLSKYAWKK